MRRFWKREHVNAPFLWAILALTAVAYVPSLGNAFVTFDDNLLIYENPLVASFSPAIFWTFDPELYVPLTLLSYQLEHLFFGFNPLIYHLTNLLLHLISIVLVFRIARRLSRHSSPDYAEAIGLACAALFALHPLNTEAVSWAAARKDILSGCLLLGSFSLYLSYREADERKTYFVSLALFLLSLLAKVSAAIFPLLLILTEIFLNGKLTKKRFMEGIPYVLLAILFVAIGIVGKQGQLSSLTAIDTLLLLSKSAVFLLSKIFWPTGLTALHPQEHPFMILDTDILVSLACIAFLLIFSFAGWKRWKPLPFGILFFMIALLPTVGSFWKNGFIYFSAERYAYVPMIGILFGITAILVPTLSKHISLKRAFMTISGLLLLTLAFLTLRQSLVWKDGETLYKRVLTFHPLSPHALNNLGTTYYHEGKYEEALVAYDKALSGTLHLPETYANKGLTLLKLDKPEDAQIAFLAGTQSLPTHRPLLESDLMPFLFLADIRQQQGRMDEAITLLESAMEAGPDFPRAQMKLAILLQESGRRDETETMLRKVIELDTRNIDALYRLAAIEGERGSIREAIDLLERVEEINPGYERTQEHLKNLRSIESRMQ